MRKEKIGFGCATARLVIEKVHHYNRFVKDHEEDDELEERKISLATFDLKDFFTNV